MYSKHNDCSEHIFNIQITLEHSHNSIEPIEAHNMTEKSCKFACFGRVHGNSLTPPPKKTVEHIFSSNVLFLLHNASYVGNNIS